MGNNNDINLGEIDSEKIADSFGEAGEYGSDVAMKIEATMKADSIEEESTEILFNEASENAEATVILQVAVAENAGTAGEAAVTENAGTAGEAVVTENVGTVGEAAVITDTLANTEATGNEADKKASNDNESYNSLSDNEGMPKDNGKLLKKKKTIITMVAVLACFIVIMVIANIIAFNVRKNKSDDSENVIPVVTQLEDKETEEVKPESGNDVEKDSDKADDNEKDGNVEVADLGDTEVPEDIEEELIENGTPVEVHGKLTLNGTQIVDSKGRAFQINGVSTHGISWFPEFVNYEAFKTIRDDWGANCIRIAMYSGEYNGYCTGGNKDNLKNIVNNGVDYATSLGMYVIIDWHVLGDQNPNVYKSEAKNFFTEMSAKYADYENVIYEICNEPNGGTSWSDIKSYAEEVIPVIKANDPEAIIIVGTPNWSQYVDQAAANPITGYSNIMYALHFYAATHKDDLRNKMTAAIDSGLPVFVSEFGICEASGNGYIDYAEANKWIEVMNQKGVSYNIWSLCNKDEKSALINSWCSKKSGWDYNDLSTEGKWYVDLLGGYQSDSNTENNSNADNNGGNNNVADAGNNNTGNGSQAGNNNQTGNGGQTGNNNQTGNGGQTGNNNQTGNGGQTGNNNQTGNGGQTGNNNQTGNGGQTGNNNQTGNSGQTGNNNQTGGNTDNGGQTGNSGNGGGNTTPSNPPADQPSNPPSNPGPQEPETPPAPPTGGGSVSASLSKSSSWPEGNKTCCTISLDVKATGGDVSSWTVYIDFGTGVEITNIWGGTYTISGNSVAISGSAWASGIQNGGSVSVGFNCKMDADVTPTVRY